MTDGPSASLSSNKAPIWGKTRFLLLSDSCGFVDLGRSLWRKDGSVVHTWCWPSPAQLISGPSPLGLATIFYCLRFENSLFVASYDSQGYGGGIRPRLHTGASRIHECTAFYNFYATGIEVTMSKRSSVLLCCHGNAFVTIRCRGNKCLPSRCLAKITSAYVIIPAFKQCLHSRCLANINIPSQYISDDGPVWPKHIMTLHESMTMWWFDQ
jgi:hypothetical protein